MSGPWQTERLQAFQGVSFDERRAFFFAPISGSTDPQDLTPLDLTGVTSVRMNIRAAQDASSTSLQTLGIGTGITLISDTFTPGPALPSAPNGVEIKLTASQTLAMNGGVAIRNAYYDVLVDMPDGTTLLLMNGPFDLLPTVTR